MPTDPERPAATGTDREIHTRFHTHRAHVGAARPGGVLTHERCSRPLAPRPPGAWGGPAGARWASRGRVWHCGGASGHTYRPLHAVCRRIHLGLRAAAYLADPASGCRKKRDALRRARRARADWAAGDRDFPAIGWHTLRHSFATALLSNGVDLRTVQDLMRHKTAAMTMRYAHSTSERRRAAVGKVLA